MSAYDSPAPLPQTDDSPGDWLRNLLRTFIRGNGFYILSMVLMVYGCHKLVRTVVVSGVEAEFARTALSLGILQAYEVLVIATAVLVVRRFRILGDGGTLLLIEAALLLDPTFFANSFLTMSGERGVAVNAICLALVPLKLALLQSLVGVRLSRRMWYGFLLTGAIIYLLPWPLDRRATPVLSLYGYYFALGILIFVVALLLPARGEAVSFGTTGKAGEFATAAQRRWIPAVIVALPVLIAAAHYIETARVYTLAFYPANLVPLVLSIAGLLVTHGTPGAEQGGRRLAVDLLIGLALVLALPPFNIPSKYDMQRPTWAIPEFINSSWPLLWAGLAGMGVYAYFWLRLRDPRALRRLAAMMVAGIAVGIWKSGAVAAASRVSMSALEGVGRGLGSVFSAIGHGIGWTVTMLLEGLRWAGLLAISYPDAALVTLLALAIWLARKYPGYGTWFVAGALGMVGAFRLLPGPIGLQLVELGEAILILAVALSHRFHREAERGGRYFGALLVCVIASVRLRAEPGALTGIFLALEVALLMYAGMAWRERFYLWLAAAQTFSATLFLGEVARLHVPVAVLAIAAGLVLFALALTVTFQKQRLLAWLQPAPIAEAGTGEAEKNEESGGKD